MKRALLDFLRGFAAAFNWWPSHDNRPPRLGDFRDDARALRGDWRAVGGDMRTAIEEWERKYDQRR
jgi:hypothetical protein